MRTNMERSTFSNKPRNMRISPVSLTPRNQRNNLDDASAARRGEPRKENHFSFGKIPNKKG